METKELKIEIPDGYQIDKVNSTLELIKFKPIEKATYEYISKELFKDGGFFFTSKGSFFSLNMNGDENDSNNCTSKEQAKKVLAINKLLNVAKYLNNGWKPNWSNITECKWFIEIINPEGSIKKDGTYYFNSRIVYFKTGKLVEQAIEILGKETIKLALSTDY